MTTNQTQQQTSCQHFCSDTHSQYWLCDTLKSQSPKQWQASKVPQPNPPASICYNRTPNVTTVTMSTEKSGGRVNYMCQSLQLHTKRGHNRSTAPEQLHCLFGIAYCHGTSAGAQQAVTHHTTCTLQLNTMCHIRQVEKGPQQQAEGPDPTGHQHDNHSALGSYTQQHSRCWATCRSVPMLHSWHSSACTTHHVKMQLELPLPLLLLLATTATAG